MGNGSVPIGGSRLLSLLVSVNTTSSLLTYNYHSDLAKFQRGGIAREFNNKWLYISAAGLFEIGSAISGAAPTMSVLVFGRVLAGIGARGYMLVLLIF
jgi:MFS family permease